MAQKKKPSENQYVRNIDELRRKNKELEDSIYRIQNSADSKQGEGEMADFLRPKVLIVDDLIENLYLLAEILEELDVEIILAQSGQEAIEKTQAHDFAIILIDVQMPEMSGFEAVEIIRKKNAHKFLPIIFITAVFYEKSYQIQGIKTGAVDFITKPVIPEILIGKVKVFVELFTQKRRLEAINTQFKILIDQQKEAENELEKYRLHLEDIVEDRTRDLLKAKDRAEESDRLKTAFLANMSHELRTPMNAIIGFSSMLADPDIQGEEKLEFITHIEESGNTLLSLIDDIIDIARIESGDLDISLGDLMLNDLLERTYAFILKERKKFNKAHIDVKLLLPSDTDLQQIVTDGGRVEQVLQTMLKNALKFTEEGSIEYGYSLEGNSSLLFFVRDTGIGIPEDQQHIIFDRFRKGEVNNTRLYGGAGLGLTISKRIIDLLGGEIWLESAVNQGTTFYFTLPFMLASDS